MVLFIGMLNKQKWRLLGMESLFLIYGRFHVQCFIWDYNTSPIFFKRVWMTKDSQNTCWVLNRHIPVHNIAKQMRREVALYMVI